MKLLTLKNRSAMRASDSHAVSTQSAHRLVTRVASDRRPSTSGMPRSVPAAICQATPIDFAAARKYRWGRSWMPRRKQSRRARRLSPTPSFPARRWG